LIIGYEKRGTNLNVYSSFM
jgi:hypothetical protein